MRSEKFVMKTTRLISHEDENENKRNYFIYLRFLSFILLTVEFFDCTEGNTSLFDVKIGTFVINHRNFGFSN
jgi:hypothetical protein